MFRSVICVYCKCYCDIFFKNPTQSLSCNIVKMTNIFLFLWDLRNVCIVAAPCKLWPPSRYKSQYVGNWLKNLPEVICCNLAGQKVFVKAHLMWCSVTLNLVCVSIVAMAKLAFSIWCSPSSEGFGRFISLLKPLNKKPFLFFLILRILLNNGLLLNLTLKTHWARADYLEYGIGYTFNYRTKWSGLIYS